MGGQLVEPAGVAVDVLAIDQLVAHDDVHHGEGEGHVGSGSDLDEPVGFVGRDGTNRVDHDDLGAVGASFLDERPQVTIGQTSVRSPQDDVLRVLHVERIGGERRAE